MTKEELEKDYYADRPTEPYCDDDSPNDWANIAHYAEENLEKAFKRIADLEEKISVLLSCKNCSENKGGFICQKEYKDKCLAQKIQYIKELQEENAESKCECRTCVYTDSPCVRSDYPSKDGVCSHYKNVFEENTELRLKLEALEGQTPWKDIKDKSELIGKFTKAKICLEQLVSEITVGELEVDPNVLQQAENFLKEC